ncbi:hypothetical protein DRD23_09145 [Salmonella enterica subsp. enterica serovar Enteritidis]|nr:hypothetical protein [Salmonella enterica subsp. enterica serovar Enteritidis]
MKVAIVGAGVRPGEPGFFLREELRNSGIEIADEQEITAATIAQKHMIDGLDEFGRVIEHKMRENVVVIPRSAPTESFTGRTRNTGAARIKREAKRRSRKRR